MKHEAEGIRAVREIRKRISAELDHDVEKLLEYYMEKQKQHRDRLLQPVSVRRDLPDDAGNSGRVTQPD